MSSSVETRKTTSKSKQRDQVTASPPRLEAEPGGVRLVQDEDGEVVTKVPTASRRKRRPKKIPVKDGEAVDASNGADGKPETIGIEVEALKSKVQEIEAQVQEILLRPQGPTKSARRRAKHQKGAQPAPSSDPVQAEEGATDITAEAQTTATVELQRLQDELLDAQNELLTLKEKSSHADSVPKAVDEDDVEDVVRTHEPGLVEVSRPRPLGRSVTLSGSYRIPIPVNVSDSDFDAISRGIKSAQSIARAFIDATPAESRPAQSTSSQSASSGTWSEWIGGYSMSIAKAVDKVRITSNLETVPKPPARPAIAGRSETAPPARRKPQKLELRGRKRDEIANPQRKLSETQVAGLMA